MVAVTGGALAVETVGAGPPLVMLHGWTLDRRLWLPQLPLARDFRLVGIDRRGFGQSTAPADLAAEPDDVLAVADALGCAKFHLLGMSQGGRVALALAARAPDRLLSLILQGTALDGVAAADESVPRAAMAAAAAAGDRAALRALWGRHALMRALTTESRMLAAAMLADYDGHDLLVPGRELPALAAMAAGSGVPVTAIVGAGDTAQRRANAAALGRAGAAVVELTGGGHLCNADRADAFNAIVGGSPVRQQVRGLPATRG